jgi:hypothetical protein
MSIPTIIKIQLTPDERGIVFGNRKQLLGGAGIAIIRARQRIDPATGIGEMLPQCLETCRQASHQMSKHTGTYQTMLKTLIAAAERGLQTQAQVAS